MNNDLYNKTIEVDGQVYHYDPDQDIYYRRYGEQSIWDRWAWVATIVILAIACYITA